MTLATSATIACSTWQSILKIHTQLNTLPSDRVPTSLTVDEKKKWQEDGKRAFDQALRKNSCSKHINSITVYPEHPEDHYSFIAELSIICSKNRTLRIKERENDYKSKSLNPEHPKYYDP